MIIPVKCFTCGKVIANKWAAYMRKVEQLEEKNKQQKESIKTDHSEELVGNFDSNFKGAVLDELGLDRICCRRHMLSHIELVDLI